MTVFERMQSRARNYVQQACAEASSGAAMYDSYGSVQSKVKPEVRKNTLDQVALALAAILVGEKYGEEELGNGEAGETREAELFAEMERTKQDLLQDPEFKAVMDNASLSEIRDMLGDPETYKGRKNQFDDTVVEKTRMMYNAVKPDEFTTRFYAKLQTPEVQQRKAELQEQQRFKNLVNELKATTSKSFTGKLKSFFVGNSKEYDAAFKAIQGLSDGTVSKDKAREDIMKYLNLRGSKVRDHQYGKDRFDAMLRGLSSVMEPEAFIDYCKGIDKARFDRSKGAYKGHIDAKAYMSDETKQKLAENERKRVQARLREEAVKRVDYDSLKIAKDLKDDDRYSENERFLKYLRRIKERDLGPSKSEQLRGYMLEHPTVREEARKIVEERGMDIEVPLTAVDLMDDQTKEVMGNAKTGLEEEPKQNKQQPQKDQKVENNGPEIGNR